MYDILLLMVPGHYTADFLIKIMICSMQEGCMTPGDKLLPVNGESALGYTVEKVHCVEINCNHILFSLKTRIPQRFPEGIKFKQQNLK